MYKIFFNYTKRLVLLMVILSQTLSFAQERGAVRANDSAETFGKTRALIIGVSEYPNLDKNMQLDYAHKDALLFQDFLLSVPDLVEEDDVKVLLNEEANNYNTILSSFVQILMDAEEGDLVILFFAGHGDIQNILGQDDGFLLLNEIDAPHIRDYHNNKDALPINSIKDYTSRVTSQKAIKNLERAISMDEENVFYYIKLLELQGIDTPQKAVEYLNKNYPNANADYFKRKNVSDYSFFNFN